MTFEAISIWVSQHETIITLVVLPVVFFVLTHWIANRTDERASKDRAEQRHLQKQIRLAEFEVEATRELRRDFVALISGLRSWRLHNEPTHESVTDSYHKLLLGLDSQNPNYARLIEIVENLLTAPDFPVFYEGHEELKKLSVRFLENARFSAYSRLHAKNEVEPD